MPLLKHLADYAEIFSQNLTRAFAIEPLNPDSPTSSESIPDQTTTMPTITIAAVPPIHQLPLLFIPRNDASPNLCAMAKTPPPPDLTLTRDLSEPSDSEIGNSPIPPRLRRISLTGYLPYGRGGIQTPGNCCILTDLQSPKHGQDSCTPDCESSEDKQNSSRRGSLKS
jgi:hypothetical protein